MRIGLDAMGGDLGVAEIVAGALDAAELLSSDDRVVLVGDKKQIEAVLPETGCEHIDIVHASQAVGMAESPVEAHKSKPDNSIAVMTGLHKKNEIDACISAGNTGACVAAGLMHLGRLPGVQRPGIAIIAPTAKGPLAICDVGANVNCRPMHLYQYAVMTSLYMKSVTGIENPRVALLSVGEEEGKGNSLVKKTTELLKQDDSINFIGNVESRDLVKGACDVMICEGFVGNVVLKLIEGVGEGMMKMLVSALLEQMPDRKEEILTAVNKISHMYDANQYGGAPLLGVDGIWIICHGASDRLGIKNAIRVVKELAADKVNQHITEILGEK